MNDPFQDTGTVRALRRERPRPPLAGLAMIGAAVAVGLFLKGIEPGPMPVPLATAAPVEAAAAPFLPEAIGVAARDATLRARPGGKALAPVAAGTALRIGGRAKAPAALGTRDAYWVSPVGENAVYGWLWDTEVLVTQGAPPLMDGLPEGRVQEGIRVASAQEARTVAPTAPPVAKKGEIEIPWMTDTVMRWEELFVAEGAEHGVDPELLAIITLVESGGNPKAVSPSGAVGLMQVMPATGVGIARQRGLTASHATARLYEPAYNVDFGAWLLNQLLGQFGQANDPDWQGSVELAAMGYNGGPGSVGNPPAETRSYRRWVGGMWRERHDLTSPTFEQWSAAGGSVLVQKARSGAE